MKTGVTGATGHLGRIVIEKLKLKIPAGNIVALVRSPEKAADLDVEVREFNYDNPQDLEKSLAGIDTLLLISANEVGKRVKQHTNVIDAAKRAGVNWIVYTSILHADTSSISLAAEHYATEKAIIASGMQYTLLRNGWYTENYTGSIKGAVAAGAFIGSVGTGKIASATRVDFAEAAVAVLAGEKHQGMVYELAGDEAFTLNELAAEVSCQTGKNLPYRNLPEHEYEAILKNMGVPDLYAKAIASWDVAASKGDLFNDSHQLSKLIGRPTTKLSQTIREALAGLK
jgi:NAD(P)H dehydrogenase (quinone)